MPESINNFDFSKYDVGGTGAKAGDKMLTGDEVKKARADGWSIWECLNRNDKAVRRVPNDKGKDVCKTINNMSKSELYKKYKAKKEQILEKLLTKENIYPSIVDGKKVYSMSDRMSNKFIEAEANAKKLAKQELGLPDDAFTTPTTEKIEKFLNQLRFPSIIPPEENK